jgi:hypothetical protein
VTALLFLKGASVLVLDVEVGTAVLLPRRLPRRSISA